MTEEKNLIKVLKNEIKRLRSLIKEYQKENELLKNNIKPKRKYTKHIQEQCEEIEGEIWKDNIEYPNYLFSNLGRVKQKDKNVLVKEYSYNSYPTIIIYNKDLKRKKLKKHRIIAETFIENPHSLPEVDHIDTNKMNCNVNNLRWSWALENILLNDSTHQRLLKNIRFGRVCIRKAIKKDKIYSENNNVILLYKEETYNRLKNFNYTKEDLNI